MENSKGYIRNTEIQSRGPTNIYIPEKKDENEWEEIIKEITGKFPPIEVFIMKGPTNSPAMLMQKDPH